jgi:hypothetical protein
LTGLTCVLQENYKYAQKQNIEVKQVFFRTSYSNIIKILLDLQLFWCKHSNLISLLL